MIKLCCVRCKLEKGLWSLSIQSETGIYTWRSRRRVVGEGARDVVTSVLPSKKVLSGQVIKAKRRAESKCWYKSPRQEEGMIFQEVMR